MSEYIDREALKAVFEEDGHLSAYVEEMIDSVPAADVRPVVRGKWEQTDRAQLDEIVIASMLCDQCHLWSNTIWQFGQVAKRNKFCPNCGADMRGTNDEKA